jgi:hypothetical protein
MHVAFVVVAEAVVFGVIFGLQRVSSVFYPIYMHEFNLTAQSTATVMSPMYFVFAAVGLCSLRLQTMYNPMVQVH